MLPQVDPLPSEEDQRGLNFCPYHRRRSHNLEQCIVFCKIFDQKLEVGEILLQSERDMVEGKPRHLHKLKHFYNHMDFNPEQRLAITKSIIELTDPVENCDMVEGKPRHKGQLTTMRPCSMTVTDKDSLATITGHST